MKANLFPLVLMVVAVAAFGAGRVINVTDADVVVYGARVAFVEDGGCTIQAECATTVGVACQPAPQPFNRGASCSNFRIAAMRAATIDVGVSDGGAP